MRWFGLEAACVIAGQLTSCFVLRLSHQMSRVVTTAMGAGAPSLGGTSNLSTNCASSLPPLDSTGPIGEQSSWRNQTADLLSAPPASPGNWLPELPNLLDDLGSLGSLFDFDDLPTGWGEQGSSDVGPELLTSMDQMTAEKLQQLLEDVTQAENDPSTSYASHANHTGLARQLELLTQQHQSLLDRPMGLTAGPMSQAPLAAEQFEIAKRSSASGSKRGLREHQGATAGGGRGGSRTAAKAKEFADLQRVLDQKQAEAQLLEQQNISLKRRRRMLDTLIQIRDSQIQLWTQIAKAKQMFGSHEKIPVPWANHPVLGSMSLDEMLHMTPERAAAFFR